MALIKCAECGKEISDKAPSCPSCGNPINNKLQQKPVVIEQTYKKWKVVKLVSGILIVIGIFNLFGGINNHNDPSISFGIFILFIGIIGSIIGKFGAWWNNR